MASRSYIPKADSLRTTARLRAVHSFATTFSEGRCDVPSSSLLNALSQAHALAIIALLCENFANIGSKLCLAKGFGRAHVVDVL